MCRFLMLCFSVCYLFFGQLLVLFEPFCPVDSVLFIAFYCSTCCLFYLCLQIKYNYLLIYLFIYVIVRSAIDELANIGC